MTAIEFRQRVRPGKSVTPVRHEDELGNSGGWWETLPSRAFLLGNTQREVLAWAKTFETKQPASLFKAHSVACSDPQLLGAPLSDFKWLRIGRAVKYSLPDEFARKIPHSWMMLGVALLLESQGRVDDAMDVIYTDIDELMRSGADAEINALLEAAPVESLTVNVMLALLTSTLPRKHHLKSRTNLYERVASELRRRDAVEDGILDGLE